MNGGCQWKTALFVAALTPERMEDTRRRRFDSKVLFYSFGFDFDLKNERQVKKKI